MKKFSTNLRVIAAAALMTFGGLVASNASAGEIFTVDPTAIAGFAPGNFARFGSSFEADQMLGNSSARIVSTGGGNYAGTGYIVYSSFAKAGSPIFSDVSYLNFSYQVYATFTQTFACGAAFSVGSTCSVTGIALDMYADQNKNTVFAPASVGANYGITGNGTDKHLGSVNTVMSGTAGINSLGGAFQNINTNFALTADGKLFFTGPPAFYTNAFSAFNNSSLGLACNTGNGAACVFPSIIALNQEAGTTDFLSPTVVPEPASVALFGIALAGVAVARRRKTL